MKTITLFVGDEDGLRDVPEKVDGRTIRHGSHTDATYGRALKLRRVYLGFSQVEFAKLLGIHQVTLSRLETGTSPLTENMHSRIEDVFNQLKG